MNTLQAQTAYVGGTEIKQVRLGNELVLAPNGDILWYKANELPSLDLRFAANKSLVDATTGTNLIDFTRASSGTYVGSDGLIKTATTNLLLRSEEFDNAYWTKTNTTVTQNATTSPNGTTTADLVAATGATDSINKAVTVDSGAIVAFSLYMKRANMDWVRLTLLNGVNEVRAWFNLSTGAVGTVNTAGTGTSASASIQNSGDGWYRCVLFGAIPGATSYTFFNATAANDASFTRVTGGERYLWGAQLEQSSTVGEYVKTTSTINSAPRFDHDPTTGESLGLLVEESRTNLLLQSNGFDTTWTNSLSTETANAGTAPDGTNTAWELKDTVDATASQHLLSQTPASFVSGTTYSYSVWAKSGTLTHIALTFPSSAFTSTLTTRYSLQTGTAVSVAAGTTATVTAFPNNWYRVTTTATATASASGVLNIRLATAGTTSYQGDGTGTILIWGAQLEAGAFPTSYIPTTTATATRSADVASISGSNFSSWYRQDEGTVFTEIIPRQFSQAFGVLSLDDGTTSERVQTRYSTTGSGALVVSDGGTVQANFATLNTATTQIRSRLATSYAINSFNACLDGGQIASDASGTLPTPTQGVIGNAVGANYANAPISRLTFWPTRLPNETLQTITQ